MAPPRRFVCKPTTAPYKHGEKVDRTNLHIYGETIFKPQRNAHEALTYTFALGALTSGYLAAQYLAPPRRFVCVLSTAPYKHGEKVGRTNLHIYGGTIRKPQRNAHAALTCTFALGALTSGNLAAQYLAPPRRFVCKQLHRTEWAKCRYKNLRGTMQTTIKTTVKAPFTLNKSIANRCPRTPFLLTYFRAKTEDEVVCRKYGQQPCRNSATVNCANSKKAWAS